VQHFMLEKSTLYVCPSIPNNLHFLHIHHLDENASEMDCLGILPFLMFASTPLEETHEEAKNLQPSLKYHVSCAVAPL
jgi:hypothetical protein